MNVKIYYSTNNEYETSTSEAMSVENLESCFMLPDKRMLIAADGKTKIYDDCILFGMEEITEDSK